MACDRVGDLTVVRLESRGLLAHPSIRGLRTQAFRRFCAPCGGLASGDVQERGGQPLLSVRSSQMIRGRTLRSAAYS
jgi:hypothetical protein